LLGLSIRKKEVKELENKAKEFLQGARRALSDGHYNLSCFLYEQALQLLLKSKLLAKYGDYPRTHSLLVLLNQMENDIPSITSFIKKNRASISSLEDAYILARYSEKVYVREDAEDANRLFDKITEIIGQSEKAKE
jgi:HEPN domain-containing protein